MAEPKASPSGICFLLFLVFIGPSFYLCRHWYRQHTGYNEEDAQKSVALASKSADQIVRSERDEGDLGKEREKKCRT